MKKMLLNAIALLLVAAPLAAFGEEEPREYGPSLDIEGMTCRYLLVAGGDERDLLLSFFHGYMAGKAGPNAIHDVERMARHTDEVIGWCVGNPAETLVRAFTEVRASDKGRGR